MSKSALAKIPAFPQVIVRVLELLSNEDVRMEDLSKTIESDALLSGQLLRTANSPLFGLRAQIDNVQSAVVTLGLSRLQELTTSVAAADYMRSEMKNKDLYRCWRHTLATAMISRAVARACSLPEERAYTIGLLHDIGRLGLLVAFPDKYAAMLRAASGEPRAVLDRERELFDVDHCEAGAFLAEQWELPAEFRLVAEQHHGTMRDDSPVEVVHASLACQMADAMGFAVIDAPPQSSLKDLCQKLPVAARKSFLAGAGALKSAIILNLEAHDLSAMGAVDAAPKDSSDPAPKAPAPAEASALAACRAAARKTPAVFRRLPVPPVRGLRLAAAAALVVAVVAAAISLRWLP